jgi:hypothetical protein
MSLYLSWEVKEYELLLGTLPLCPAIIIWGGPEGWRVWLIFQTKDEPEEGISEDYRLGWSFLPPEQLSWYADLLRNEKPVRIGLTSSSSGTSFELSTGPEPVGEEELAALKALK